MGAYWVPTTRNEGPPPDCDPFVVVVLILLVAVVGVTVWLGHLLGLLP
jgi:hypothetical protein